MDFFDPPGYGLYAGHLRFRTPAAVAARPRREHGLGLVLLLGIALTVWLGLLVLGTLAVRLDLAGGPAVRAFAEACDPMIRALLWTDAGAFLVTVGTAWRVVARGEGLRDSLRDAARGFL